VKKQLQPWQITALLTAQELNWNLQQDAAGRLYVQLGADKIRYISNGVHGVKLYWRLIGCLPGVQHFKWCEPRAAATVDSLGCKQCACVVAKSAGAHQQVLCASEQQLACMLHELNISSSMCAQVAVDWWRGRVDFLHAQHSMLIQADGSCHDTGAYKSSAKQLVKRDAGFCFAAYSKYMPTGGSVLRVRTCESDLDELLQTGFNLAAAGRVIVLSPSYSDVMCDLDGSGLRSFPAALVAALHGCVYENEQGWHVIRWQQPVG
jgi:very-short-patch-repair endonuclease